MKKSDLSPSRSTAAAARQDAGGNAGQAIASSPRMLAQRRQLEGAFGDAMPGRVAGESAQLAAKKDKKLKK